MTPAQASRVAVLDLEGVVAALGIHANEAEAGIPYTVIRGHDGPRWLIPAGSALAQTILREWRPYRLTTRLFWLATVAAYRMGAGGLMPGAAGIMLPASLSGQLMRRIGCDFDAGPPVILVGNLTITRKILVFLEDRAARKNVLVKIPLTVRAAASIRNEARVLEELNGRLRAPRLLYRNESEGIAMQEYLHGRLGSRRCRPEYTGLLCGLAESDAKAALRDHGRQLQERLRNGAEHAEHAARIHAALALLDEDTKLPCVTVHGDFAPWNIRDLPDGACTLIDWEAARPNGLPLHDLCHFYFMQMRLFTPQKLFFREMLREGAWKDYCRSLDIAARLLKPLAAAFLLETLAGYWETGETGVDAFCLRQLDELLAFTDETAQY